MNPLTRIACATTLFAFAGAGFAAPPMKEGQWEMTIQSKMEGMPMQPPPMTFKHCYTAKDTADSRAMVEKQMSGDGQCKMLDYKEAGNTVNFSMKCQTRQGESLTSGSSTYKGDSYTANLKMRFKMEGREMEMTQVHQGRRTGACQAG